MIATDYFLHFFDKTDVPYFSLICPCIFRCASWEMGLALFLGNIESGILSDFGNGGQTCLGGWEFEIVWGRHVAVKDRSHIIKELLGGSSAKSRAIGVRYRR